MKNILSELLKRKQVTHTPFQKTVTIEINTYKWHENPNTSEIYTERSNHASYTAHHASTSNSK